MARLTRPLLVVLALVLVAVAGRLIDVRRVAGDIKGDESTYIAMAFSLAEDGDLRYQPEDYRRFVSLYGHGPSGIFLKRRYHLGLEGKEAVPSSESLAYGKALAYPVAAAPFVALGGLGGLLVFNWVLLAICLVCGARFCRALMRSRAGWVVAVIFLGASVVPVYATWLTSEVFNFTLVFVGYFLWLYKKVAPRDESSWLMRPGTTLAAAVLIGIATFSKATNAAMIAPIVLDAILARQAVRVVVLGLAFAAGVAGLFGVNAAITGEANYQGAADSVSRRYFTDHYPFDPDGTAFDEKGSAMVTNDADTARVLDDSALVQVPINTLYFFIGRHAGLVPYYLPGVVILLHWASRAWRAPAWQWGIAVALMGSIGALIVFFPDSWNGGGGPPGNRYFLSLYPTLLFLAPAGMSFWPSALALIGGAAFTGAMVLHPYDASAKPWLNPERRPLNDLPIELTLINDLPCRLNVLRCPITFIAEPTVQFYYMDGRTYSAEKSPGSDIVDGTWIAGGTSTDIIVKTDRPPSRVRIEFSSPIDNMVTGRFADKSFKASVLANGKSAVSVTRPAPFRYHQNSVYVLHLDTANGFVPTERDPGSKDTRNLGVFIRPTFDYDDPR
ncbi:MAG: hypothetical protein ABI051_03560 [Vicinamibacterales bacterium]